MSVFLSSSDEGLALKGLWKGGNDRYDMFRLDLGTFGCSMLPSWRIYDKKYCCREEFGAEFIVFGKNDNFDNCDFIIYPETNFKTLDPQKMIIQLMICQIYPIWLYSGEEKWAIFIKNEHWVKIRLRLKLIILTQISSLEYQN